MNLREFLKELRKVRKEFLWTYAPNPSYVGLRGKRGKTLYCPITAVCYSKNKKKFKTYNYDKAAMVLDLPRKTAEKIVDAADYGENSVLCQRLLKAISDE